MTDQLINQVMEVSKPINKEKICEFLECSRNTLEYYNGQGLPRFQIGNEVRYYIPDVLKFFRERSDLNKKKRFEHADEA